MNKEHAMTVSEGFSDNILLTISNAAKDPTVDVEKAERLFALLERMMARSSEEKFNSAMSECQQEMPRVLRDAQNPSTNSRFTRLETLNDAAVPIYTKHGFSLSFGSADCPIADHYRITCVAAHKGGHSRSYQCDLPRDDMGAKGSPNKTKIHGAGSTFSYGRRYLTLLIFNISLVNEDDDGNRGQRQKPAGPSSLAGVKMQSGTDIELKRKLVDLTRGIHFAKGYNLTDDGRAKLTQYLVDETFISDTQTVSDLSGDELSKVVAKVEAKLQGR